MIGLIVAFVVAADSPSTPTVYPMDQIMHVGGATMLPLLRDGQAVTVHIPAYGCRQKARRGDVVLYIQPSPSGNSYLSMKRVVGVPGDTVEFAGGRLILNGAKVGYAQVEGWIVESLPDGPSYRLQFKSGEQLGRDVAPVKLENSYYIVGDNRDNSADSRLEGPIPGDFICGFVTLPASAPQP